MPGSYATEMLLRVNWIEFLSNDSFTVLNSFLAVIHSHIVSPKVKIYYISIIRPTKTTTSISKSC